MEWCVFNTPFWNRAYSIKWKWDFFFDGCGLNNCHTQDAITDYSSEFKGRLSGYSSPPPPPLPFCSVTIIELLRSLSCSEHRWYAYDTDFWSIKAQIGASPDTGRAEGECLYLATSTDLNLYRLKSSTISILSYDHPHVKLIIKLFRLQCVSKRK